MFRSDCRYTLFGDKRKIHEVPGCSANDARRNRKIRQDFLRVRQESRDRVFSGKPGEFYPLVIKPKRQFSAVSSAYRPYFFVLRRSTHVLFYILPKK